MARYDLTAAASSESDAGRVQQDHHPCPVLWLQALAQRALEQVERIGEGLALRQDAPPGDRSSDEEDDDEDHVDERDRRPEQVVVVGGQELADLVDERPEPEARDDRCDVLDRAVEIAQQQDQRHEHQGAAPQHVRDMELTAADPREPRHRQEGADAEERDDRRDQEALEEERPIAVAERRDDAPEHPVSIGGADGRGHRSERDERLAG